LIPFNRDFTPDYKGCGNALFVSTANNKNDMRYNSFNKVHKALRAFLYDTALKLQQTDFTNKEAGENLLVQIEQLLLLFESHAHNEDHFFNKPLEEVNKEVAILFEKEHEEDHRLAIVLKKAIKDWRAASTISERSMAGSNLFYAFNEFIAFNLYHMNREETLLNQVLWDNYTDDQIKITEKQIVQNTAPEKMMMYASWMIRGINTKEMIHWMRELSVMAPKPLYEQVYTMAKQIWGEMRWREVEEALRPMLVL
jgi:hypothetical protein